MKRFDSPFSPLSDPTAVSPSPVAPASQGVEPTAGANPFAADVCQGPYGIDEQQSVPGMNADLLQQLTDAVDEHAGAQRGQAIVLLTAPRAGYGKTHLLGRLTQAAGQRVAVLPVAFRTGDSVGWQSVARRGIEAMERAETGTPGWTRLREACAGVLSSLLKLLIDDGRLPCANPQQAVQVLTGPVESIFDGGGQAYLIGQWLTKHVAQLRRPLSERVCRQTGISDLSLAEAWLQAVYDLGTSGASSGAALLKDLATRHDDGCQHLLRLIALWRPAVVLVDHLDAFYRNADAGLRIASLLLDLTELDGVHVVLSLNQDVWQATFGHHLPSALEDRLTSSQLLLRGLTAADAGELVRLRLQEHGVPEHDASAFERFIDVRRYFMGRPLGSVSARAFLRHASLQWQTFQTSGGSTASHDPLLDEPDTGAEDMLLPNLATSEAPAAPAPGGPFKVFDTNAGTFVRQTAEGLAEPVAALPQDAPPPAPAAAPTQEPPPPASIQPQSLLPDDDVPLLNPATTPPHSTTPPENAGTEESAEASRSLGNFEKLRDMLERLRRTGGRSPDAPPPGTPPTALPPAAGSSAAQRLAGVMAGGGAASSAQSGQDSLLGRFEALKMQLAAEAESRPLDLARVTDLIRLAGRRFPLVKPSENELPGQTGRRVLGWSIQGMEVFFGLAPFTDTVWWQTLCGYAAGRIATSLATATRTGEPAPSFKIVAFKSDRDTAQWAQFLDSGLIPDGLRNSMDPVHLNTRSVAALYATHRIIKEAETGALAAGPNQVMSLLARELDFFWKRVTRPLRTGA